MNPWRVLEKIARHEGGRFSKSRGLSAHRPLRFEVISRKVEILGCLYPIEIPQVRCILDHATTSLLPS